MSRPTDAAYDAAMEILHGPFGFFSNDLPKPTAIEVALVIDKHTLLPEKHAALMLAQGVVDIAEQAYGRMTAVPGSALEQIHLLREALTRIQNPSSSPGACVQNVYKEPGSKPPQVVEDPPHSPS